MKKHLLTLACLAFTSFNSFAEWSIQAKLGPEQKSYTLTINDTYEGTADIGGLAVGISAVNPNGWFIDIENSFGDDEIEGFFGASEAIIERNDTSISVGKSVDGLVLFGGYKITESEVSCDDCLMMNSTHPVLSTDFKFVTTGFFAGLAKTFPLAKNHFTNLALAAGMMDGEYDPENGEGGSNSSLGYSVTASYIFKANNNWTLSTGVKAQAYEYDELNDNTNNVTTANEEFTTLFLKASYTL